MQAAVRIGLVLRGSVAAWQAEVIEQMTSGGVATIVAVFELDAADLPRRSTSVLYRWYQRLDRRLVHLAHDPAAVVHDVPALAGVPRLASDVPDVPPAVDPLDVLLCFDGDDVPARRLAPRARHGAWTFHCGDATLAAAPFLNEAREGHATTGVSIVQTRADGATRLLDRIEVATEPGLSQRRNSVQPLWALACRIVGLIARLHDTGEVIAKDVIDAQPLHGGAQQTSPSNVAMAAWLGPSILRKAARRFVQAPMAVHWQIALRRGPQSVLHSPMPYRTRGFVFVDAPPGRFYADPFLFHEGGTDWLFFEDFDRATGLGRLACAMVHGTTIGDVHPVLERPYHLSYPCLVRDGEDLFLVPESAANRTIDLYRCVRFPDRWEHVRTLLDRRAVDTTPFRHDGRWWFFTTLLEPHGGSGELWLFSSSSIDGHWHAHPANPISIDVRTNRNAGAIVCDRGRLFRPSQDGSGGYGSRFTLQQIVALDARTYREQEHVTFEPDLSRGQIGTHSYAHLGTLEAIDVCTRVRVRDLVRPSGGDGSRAPASG